VRGVALQMPYQPLPIDQSAVTYAHGPDSVRRPGVPAGTTVERVMRDAGGGAQGGADLADVGFVGAQVGFDRLRPVAGDRDRRPSGRDGQDGRGRGGGAASVPSPAPPGRALPPLIGQPVSRAGTRGGAEALRAGG
jgi:hypothetical protein